jgi:hypothetical protein
LLDFLNCEFLGDRNHLVTGINEIHMVEGGDLVFIINGQRIGLDCTAPSQGSPANTDKPVLPGRKLGTTLEPNQPKVRQ